jgi:hypothetical protein
MRWPWSRRRKHPHARELRGLRACLLAWHRSVLEDWHRQGVAPADELTRRLAALQGYAAGLGGTDPFTDHVLGVPVGGLEQPLYLGAHWRGETAASLAWALRLVDAIPPVDERSDMGVLEALMPLDAAPPEALRHATLRDRAELARARDDWRRQTAEADDRRAGASSELAELAFSRAFERARGLAWILDGAPSIEDVVV